VALHLNRALGLHCLLYLVADRICRPETSRRGGDISASAHPLVRVTGSMLEAVRMLWMDDRKTLVSVPCRPTVAVRKMDLGSRLLMAALLECRDEAGSSFAWPRRPAVAGGYECSTRAMGV